MFGWIFNRVIVFTPYSQSKYDNLRISGVVDEKYHEIPQLEDLHKIADAFKNGCGYIIILDDIMSGWNEGLNLDKVFTIL